MSRLIPGGDTPSGSGAKGLFARDIQGQTPKYAINEGEREDDYRNGLCRFFVSVAPNEMDFFRRSVADPMINRRSVLDRLTGDPRGAKGYIDFILQGAALPFKELIQVGQALSGDHVVYTFDQAPVNVPLQGIFINTIQDDQATYFIRLYLHILRASALARRQKLVSLKMDAYILTGALIDLQVSFENRMEVAIPFQMTLLLKRLSIVEYTQSWRPTAVSTPFAEDLNSVPRDSRVVVERPIHTSTVRTPNDLDEEVARGETDARVGEAPAAPTPTAPQFTPEQLAAAAAQQAVARLDSQIAVAVINVADLDRRANTQLSDAGATGSTDAYLRTTAERDVARRQLEQLRTEHAQAVTRSNEAQARLTQPAPTPNTAPTPTPASMPAAVRSGPAPETH